MYVTDTRIDKRLEPLKFELSNLVYQYLNKNNVNITQRKRTAINTAVSCFLFNTHHKVARGINLVGVTLHSNHYSQPYIVNGRKAGGKVSYQYTRILFDCLESLGYITLNKGKVVYGLVAGKWDIVDFESGFIEIHKPLITIYKSIELPKQLAQRSNVIIIRDENGVDVTFRMNDFLRLRRELLDGYNKLSLVNEVGMEDSTYDVQMYKVYNSKSCDRGARNYMSKEGIQWLSKKERMLLTINKNDTAIYDYKAFEPSIAYSMIHEEMVGDPYTIILDGYDPVVLRDICKLVMLIMFNLEDPTYLSQTINQAIRDGFKVNELYEQGKIPDKRIDVKTIVEKLESKHHLIRHMFYGKFHTQPHYIGSLIADYITDYFTQRGILVLSVFDEFIIEKEYGDELEEVMLRAYEIILGTSVNCKIKKEK